MTNENQKKVISTIIDTQFSMMVDSLTFEAFYIAYGRLSQTIFIARQLKLITMDEFRELNECVRVLSRQTTDRISGAIN